MGGSARRVVAVVAAVTIPFVAPAIATSIGLSSAIGAAAANTVVGGTLGAISAKASGGNALIGAVTGGVGGYFGGGGGDLFAGPTVGTQQAQMLAAQDAAFGLTPSASSTALGYQAPVTAPITTAVGTGTQQAGMLSAQDAALGLTPSASSTALGYQAPVGDFGTALSGGASTTQQAQMLAAQDAALGLTPSASSTATGYQAPTAATQQAQMLAAQDAAFGPSVASPSATAYQAPVATAPAGAPAGAPTTFTEAIKRVPGAIAEKFKDPKALADMTLRAAGQLAGAALAGDGLSDEEKQLLAAERSDLERLRSENETLFRERVSAAQNLIGESRYFDPEYFGLQRARQAQIAGARSKRAGLRGLRGRQRNVAERQFDIETARTTGSAYDVGAQAATTGRLQTQQAGLSLMPSTFPSVGYAGLRGAYESADKRRRQTAGDVANLFGSLTGRSQAGSIG